MSLRVFSCLVLYDQQLMVADVGYRCVSDVTGSSQFGDVILLLLLLRYMSQINF